MLIVSKFHDYYDSAATYGIDKTVVYKRPMQAEFKLDKGLDRVICDAEYNAMVATTIRFFLVGFCGKLHLGARFEDIDNKTIGVAYNFETFCTLAQQVGWNSATREKIGFYARAFRWNGQPHFAFIETMYARDYGKEFGHLFVKLHQPIFMVIFGGHRTTAISGPYLKPWGFQKVKDPATAFQEIYMYISGVLGAPPKPPEEPSDKLKAQIHGHDGEYSFKKPPGGKKWR